jgi:hypothetical protein
MKNSPSKILGSLTGKIVAETKTLPSKTVNTAKILKDKTSDTGKSVKDEFLAGFESTSGSSKKAKIKEDKSVSLDTDNPFEIFK